MLSQCSSRSLPTSSHRSKDQCVLATFARRSLGIAPHQSPSSRSPPCLVLVWTKCIALLFASMSASTTTPSSSLGDVNVNSVKSFQPGFRIRPSSSLLIFSSTSLSYRAHASIIVSLHHSPLLVWFFNSPSILIVFRMNRYSLPEPEQLRELLQRTLEHVLSKEYLITDPLLVSQLNADFFAPVSLLAEVFLPLLSSNSDDLAAHCEDIDGRSYSHH